MTISKSVSPFSPPQYEAARFIIARLRSEAAGEKFEPSDLGIRFTRFGNLPLAVIDDTHVVTGTDFVRSALLMVWSLVSEIAEDADADPIEVIQAIALSLAENEPEPT